MSTRDWIYRLEEKGKVIPREVVELAGALMSLRSDRDYERASVCLLQLADVLEEIGDVDPFVLKHARAHALAKDLWESNSPAGCWVAGEIIARFGGRFGIYN